MPFKTRNRKISAYKRRFQFLESGAVGYLGLEDKTAAPQGPTKSKAGPRQIETSYEYVARDLTKIAIVASAIILIQVALKLARNANLWPSF